MIGFDSLLEIKPFVVIGVVDSVDSACPGCSAMESGR
jgi:hypothetical protein